MGVERDPGLVAVSGIDVAQRLAAAGRAEELPVRAGGGAVAPDPGQRQCPVSLDQAGERRGVAFLAHVPVVHPGELAQAVPLARVCHPVQAQVDAVGQVGGEQGGQLLDRPAAALVGEAIRELGPASTSSRHAVGVLRDPQRFCGVRPERHDAKAGLVQHGVGQLVGLGQCLDVSIPIRLTCSMDGPSV